ncbi:MAG: polysaccharide biosynthesis protein [Flavobacteriales bacterium]|nr:polysaccharide biosynthesis protein [Flavobacteriales bacterium]
MLFPKKHIPRWIVLLIDLGICAFAFALAYLLRFNFSIPDHELKPVPYTLSWILIVRATSFYLSKTYTSIVRFTSSKDAERIFFVVTIGTVVFAVTSIVTFFTEIGLFIIPFSVIIIDYLLTMVVMIGSRAVVKSLYMEQMNPSKAKRDVLIFGAGEAGVIAKRTLDRDAGTRYHVAAFVDDDKNKTGKTLEGVKIHHSDKLKGLLEGKKINQMVIAVQNISAERKQFVIDTCMNFDIRVLNVPPVNKWINGELSFRQIQKVRIEDLLERDPIKLDMNSIEKQIKGKRVLISGAAGSIGSEIARQLSDFKPKQLILLDQAESPLYSLEMEMKEKYSLDNFEVVLGDIRNIERMENVFRTYKPEIIYHAAAYKHVPSMENNPSEAILVNVKGSKIIADKAVEHGVADFVFVSTDKAVNPTNVMGASKRLAEIYIQGLSKQQNKTKFITTRFGNVLGSNGSVILRFRKQIEQGGPVTVTDPEVSRYFMTIPEACQLVLEAGATGEGGEIYIFDMGKSMKIDDMAKKMIRLSKMELDKDIKLVYTGLRPGEKLKEELLANEENTKPTHNPKIMIAKVREYDWDDIAKEIDILIDMFGAQNNEEIVRKMKEIVPEFISSNSVYERLDSTVPRNT